MSAAQESLEIVRRAVHGDTRALKLLLTEHHHRLAEYVQWRIPADLRATLDAEDILQETYVRVFTHINAFVPTDEKSLERWVTTIAVHRLRSVIRRHRAARRGGGTVAPWTGGGALEDSVIGLLDMLASPQRSPSRSVARLEAIQSLREEVAALPASYRQAIELVYLQGRKVAQAAGVMGRTERAIHGLCRRGVRMLAQRMGSASCYFSSTD